MLKKIKINGKIFSVFLIALVTSTVFAALPAFAMTAVDPNAKVNLTGSKTVTLTASDIAAMPTYTGVGSPRRSGGVYPLQMLGNYTGVPLQYLCNLVGGISSSSIVTVSTTVDGFTATLSYAQVHDNAYPQYNISTHEVITGQQPIMILAYGVNGTTLTSDGTGTDGDLGGPLRLIVVSNNGTSPLLINDGMATFGNSYVKYVTDIKITNPSSLMFETCDSSGTAKSSFGSGDAVYFSATGLFASTTYPVYVVQDVSAWTVRIPFPNRLSGVATSVTTDSSGNVAPTSIYTNTQSGKCDVLVDVNRDGRYDEADLLINDVVTTTSTSTLTPTPTPTLAASASPSLTSTAASSAPSPSVPEFPSVLILLASLLVIMVTILVSVRKNSRQLHPTLSTRSALSR